MWSLTPSLVSLLLHSHIFRVEAEDHWWTGSLRSILSFFLLGLLGFEVRSLHLIGRYFSAWTMPPASFALVILDLGSYVLPRLTWTVIFLFYAFHSRWDDKHAPPGPTFFCQNRVSLTSLPRLALNCNPPNLCLPKAGSVLTDGV
jgi:hypothetical protein